MVQNSEYNNLIKSIAEFSNGVTNLPQKAANLVLPFVALSKERRLAFTKEMETAAIFCMAESDRKKGEGILLKKPQEEMHFIAELFYPLWIVPWRGSRLLFDGLGVTRCTLTYDVLPEVKTFTTDMEDSAENLEAYSAALTDHAHYFRAAASAEEKTIVGLITDAFFLKDFSEYISEGEKGENSERLPTILRGMTSSKGLKRIIFPYRKV